MQNTETINALGLGPAIVLRRISMGMSRKNLTEAVGVSYPHMSSIETGKKPPSLRLMNRLAEVLGMTVTELQEMAQSPMGEVPDAALPKARGQYNPAEPTMSDLLAEIRVLRRLVEELGKKVA